MYIYIYLCIYLYFFSNNFHGCILYNLKCWYSYVHDYVYPCLCLRLHTCWCVTWAHMFIYVYVCKCIHSLDIDIYICLSVFTSVCLYVCITLPSGLLLCSLFFAAKVACEKAKMWTQKDWWVAPVTFFRRRKSTQNCEIANTCTPPAAAGARPPQVATGSLHAMAFSCASGFYSRRACRQTREETVLVPAAKTCQNSWWWSERGSRRLTEAPVVAPVFIADLYVKSSRAAASQQRSRVAETQTDRCQNAPQRSFVQQSGVRKVCYDRALWVETAGPKCSESNETSSAFRWKICEEAFSFSSNFLSTVFKGDSMHASFVHCSIVAQYSSKAPPPLRDPGRASEPTQLVSSPPKTQATDGVARHSPKNKKTNKENERIMLRFLLPSLPSFHLQNLSLSLSLSPCQIRLD